MTQDLSLGAVLSCLVYWPYTLSLGAEIKISRGVEGWQAAWDVATRVYGIGAGRIRYYSFLSQIAAINRCLAVRDLPSNIWCSSPAMADLDPADFVVTSIEGRKSLIRRGAPQTSGVCVDFLSAALNYRAGSSLRQQAISRAVGIKPGRVPSVLDATAGFGKDAFLLASQGCEVTLLERDENVFELLSDGLERGLASADGAVLQALRRLRLQQRDFLTLTPAELTCEVVYLDPMFPESKKSARVKKEMFALQEYLGAAHDGEAMWEKACLLAQRRVVVKRSKSAPLISSIKPDLQLKGSSSRFDIYLTPK